MEKAFESLGHLLLSGRSPKDPVKELYESLVALGLRRKSEAKSMLDVLDEIIVDFCAGIEDERLAMLIVSQELVRAGVDVREPSQERLLKAIEYLAEAESAFREHKTVLANRERRVGWVLAVTEISEHGGFH